MNLEITKKNYFKFGYNGKWFNQRKSKADQFDVNFSRADREIFDLRTEAVLAARDIFKKAKSDICILMSGGLDSEVCAEAFRLAKVPFRVIMHRYKNDLNIHDIAWGVIYCERHGIPYEFIDLDAVDFFSGECYEMAKEFVSYNTMLLCSARLSEKVAQKGLFPVISSGDLYLKKHGGRWVHVEKDASSILYRFQIARKIDGVFGFHQWSPELMLAFVDDVRTVRLFSNRLMENYSDITPYKYDIYSQHFNIEKRPKYHGFEKLLPLIASDYNKLTSLSSPVKQEVCIPISELRKRLICQ